MKKEPAVPLRAWDLEDGYGEEPLFRGLSLSLSPGEVVFLLGANGSGKSTLLRVLGGLRTPRKGGVEILGRKMEDLPPAWRQSASRPPQQHWISASGRWLSSDAPRDWDDWEAPRFKTNRRQNGPWHGWGWKIRQATGSANSPGGNDNASNWPP